MKHLNSTASIKFAFDAFKGHAVLLALCGLVIAGIEFLSSVFITALIMVQSKCLFTNMQQFVLCVKNYYKISSSTSEFVLFLTGSALVMLISFWSLIALVNIGLKIKDKKTASISDLFSFIPQIPQLVIGNSVVALLLAMSIWIAFLLIPFVPNMLILVILIALPFIYIFLRLFFVSLFILDKKINGLEAIRKSFDLSKGRLTEYLILFIKFGCVVVILELIYAALIYGLGANYTIDGQENNIIRLLGTLIDWIRASFRALMLADAYRQLVPKR